MNKTANTSRKYRTTNEGRSSARYLIETLRGAMAHPEDYRTPADHVEDVDALRRSLRATLTIEAVA